jgi:N-acylglucosamine-6-phosphate 2-epimerase
MPNYEMISKLVKNSCKPVIAEGNIWTPEQLLLAKQCGIYAAVVGSAITRPLLITRRFADIMSKG